jgi:hypothetical protein
MGNELTETFFQILKIAGIVFASLHFLIGIVLFAQINRMKRVVITKARGLVILLSIVHILILLAVLGLILFITF